MKNRGFTLLEMLVSVAILVMVLAMVSSLVVFGARMTRQGEEYSDTNESARLAVDTIVNNVRNSGLGMAGGVWINPTGGNNFSNYSPVIVNDNVGGLGPDDLWLVVPNPNGLATGCTQDVSPYTGSAGGGTTVQHTSNGAGSLVIRCKSSISGFPTLLVTNMLSGALVTFQGFGTNAASEVTLSYVEQSSGFSDSPSRGGFQIGDMVLPTTIQHYSLQVDAGVLWMNTGVINQAATTPVFVNSSATPIAVARGIEDFQIVVGTDPGLTDDPSKFAWSPTGVGPAWNLGLRSLRVTVASVSRRKILNDQGGPILTQDYSPRAIENHTPANAGVPDGFRRSFVTKRIELPNAYPANL
jgi:prepilin-type N-terminal cleavage/methylation domain-containing protein